MGVNRGKQFEEKIREGFECIDGVSIDRLLDPMAGYAGIRNICDFIVYKYPVQYYLECKSCYGNTLSIYGNDPKKRYGAITNNQWAGLLEKSKIYGVVAGYMIWFIDWDKTVFIDAETMKSLRDSGKKSVNANQLMDIPHIHINGTKKRVLFDYDMRDFLGGKNET